MELRNISSSCTMDKINRMLDDHLHTIPDKLQQIGYKSNSISYYAMVKEGCIPLIQYHIVMKPHHSQSKKQNQIVAFTALCTLYIVFAIFLVKIL